MRKVITKVKDLRWALHLANQVNGWVEPHEIRGVEWFFVYALS